MIDPNNSFFKQCKIFISQIQDDTVRINEFISKNQLSALRYFLKKYNSLSQIEVEEQFQKDGNNDILIITLNKIHDFQQMLRIIDKHINSDIEDNKSILFMKEELAMI